jgi:hypothetical protein
MAVQPTGFNPFVSTQANNGMFTALSDGLRQGTAYPDPSTRFRLRGCILSQNETIPMWGGVGVFMNVPGGAPPNPNYALGPICGRANGLSGSEALAGFSVFDQDYSMVTDPQNPVPRAFSGNMVAVYPLGSLARIAVACDPALVDLRGGPLGAQVSWDFVNQLLVPYTGTLTISSGTYNTTTGLVVLTMSAGIGFSAGDDIDVASLTGTGADLAQLNGNWTAIAPTGGTTITYQAPTGLGAITITGGSLTLGSGSDVALPVKVLDVQAANCEVVEYNYETPGFVTWNYDGSAAVIQI